MGDTRNNQILVRRVLKMIFGYNAKTGKWNEKIVKAVIDEGLCPTAIESLKFKAKDSNCDESNYNPRLDAHVLCSRCWLKAIEGRKLVYAEH